MPQLTLLAAQTDFSEAGELMLFIDESQVAWLEDLMWQQGYLDTGRWPAPSACCARNDLVWSWRSASTCWASAAPMTDLMAWNADRHAHARRMHGEYLRDLFLDNDLSRAATGRGPAGGADRHPRARCSRWHG